MLKPLLKLFPAAGYPVGAATVAGVFRAGDDEFAIPEYGEDEELPSGRFMRLLRASNLVKFLWLAYNRIPRRRC
jgi:hypothetical protein